MNRKVIAVVLGVVVLLLTASFGGIAYIYYLRTTPRVEVTSGSISAKDFDEMFKGDMDPKAQALPASAASRP